MLGILLGSGFKSWVLCLSVVKENQIDFARIKIDFMVVITRTGIASKYLHTTLGRFETQSKLVVRNTRTGIDLKYLLNNSRPINR